MLTRQVSTFCWLCSSVDNESVSDLVREELRQINIQMIDSSQLYDGLETLWLGSADESLAVPQVRPGHLEIVWMRVLNLSDAIVLDDS